MASYTSNETNVDAPTPSASTSSQPNGMGGSDSNGYGGPLCPGHNKPCLVLTTAQTANNTAGRQFYKCSMPEGEKCDFFEWADGMDGNFDNSNGDGNNMYSTNKLPEKPKRKRDGDCSGTGDERDSEEEKEPERSFEPLMVWKSPFQGGEAKGLPPRL